MPALEDMVNGRELGRIGTTKTVKWAAEVPIGASGATGTILFGPNGIAVAKSATGVYLATGLPVSPAGRGRFHFGVFSPLLTIDHAVITARDNAAGTATITTVKGGAAAEAASGDSFTIFYEGEGS